LDFLIEEGVVSTSREFDELVDQNQFTNFVLRVDPTTHCRREDHLYSNVMKRLQIRPVVDPMGWNTVPYSMSWKKGDRTTVPISPCQVDQTVGGINLLRLSLLDTREIVKTASSDQAKHG